jgi:hypothetical protein
LPTALGLYGIKDNDRAVGQRATIMRPQQREMDQNVPNVSNCKAEAAGRVEPFDRP